MNPFVFIILIPANRILIDQYPHSQRVYQSCSLYPNQQNQRLKMPRMRKHVKQLHLLHPIRLQQSQILRQTQGIATGINHLRRTRRFHPVTQLGTQTSTRWVDD